ncbi:unnamed protein product [Prorocentrum cordatum]|uniref:Uncharacterized protein n=1 Tax=Prorocentrum cordatum TaxID=2364126 RepID=A0ABN9U5S2_9DINO|nr:unnamed protein product [Polarella glacialis]
MREAKPEPDRVISTTLESARARVPGSGGGPWRCSARCGRRGWSPTLSIYSAWISACERSEQWQRTLALLSEMCEAKMEPNVISYGGGISACVKSEQWQRALALLSEMREAKLEPDAILCYNAGVRACEKSEQWQRVLALLSEMCELWQQAGSLPHETREAKL